MNSRRVYEIAFVGLKSGIHEYNYTIDNKFFANYGEQDFGNCQAEVKLRLNKENGFMLLKFDIAGTVDLSCDRCGNPLQMQLWDEFGLVVKIVEDAALMNEVEEDPDVYYIGKTESHLYVGDWIYEFINLSIPMQKRCRDDEMGGPKCNIEVLDKLRQMEENTKAENNPFWKGLEKFRNPE